MKKVCRRCKRLREHEAKGLCASCYHIVKGYGAYKNKSPEAKKIIREKQSKSIRNKHLMKRFGFIPKLYMYNKDVTSDGCFYGNSRCVDRTATTSGKAMWLYRCNDWPNEYYKIQVVNYNAKEEFWFRLFECRETVNLFFARLKRYPVNCLK